MQELDDNGLLREYAENNSEEAFAALVERHINKVYSAALRHTRNPSEAEEITQAVFVILAKKARSLGKKVVISGWLYQTARLTSVTYLRSEIRRARREQEAHTMQTLLNEPDETWTQMAPLLDAAMAGLNETDRYAVVLRFFDGKSMSEVGEALGATEDAAKKRLSRALEKLQRFFAKRGVSSTTAIIAGAISNNSVQAAPVALAKSVTAVAMTQGATAGASTLTLVKGVLKAMSLQKIKIAAVVGALAILAAGTTTLGVERATEKSSSADNIHYRMADDVWRFIKSVDTNRLELRLSITSDNRAVHPQDICFTIHSAIKGPILFHPSTNGTVTDFPDDPVLRQENPEVTANQPKGSMHITAWCTIPVLEERTFHYNDLVGSIDETRRTISKLNKVITPGNVGWINYFEWLLTPTPKINGIVFAFPKSVVRKATLKIQTGSQTLTYRPKGRGNVIILKLDNALLATNPEITLSESPSFIAPNISF